MCLACATTHERLDTSPQAKIYHFEGQGHPSDDLPNTARERYEISSNRLSANWRDMGVKSGQKVGLSPDNFYVVEWYGIREKYKTFTNYDIVGVGTLETGRYADGDCRGIMLGPIIKLSTDGQKIELIDGDTQQDLGHFYLTLAQSI